MDTAQLGRVEATGAIPMITWDCGDTDANVAAGADDTLITRFGHELNALGAPVLVRWFPDPNAPNATASGCLGAGGAPGYITAFRHVQQLLAAAGASNAATVWSIDTSQGSPFEWAGFYPGATSADWIAADDLSPSGGPLGPGDLTTAFGSWYSTFSTYGKPLLISNTGVPSGSQGQFLTQVTTDLSTRYPLIKALVYFDAPYGPAPTPLALDTEGQAAFRALSENPYFQPTRSPSATSVTSTLTRVTQGQPVSIAGAVDVPDIGGSITYLSDGSPLTGCSDLPVTSSVECETTALPVGTDDIVAAYSGDAERQPSSSTPLAVVVAARSEAAPGGGAAQAPAPAPPTVGAGPPSAHSTSAGACPGPAFGCRPHPTGTEAGRTGALPGLPRHRGRSEQPGSGARQPRSGRGPPDVDRPTGSELERHHQRDPARGGVRHRGHPHDHLVLRGLGPQGGERCG